MVTDIPENRDDFNVKIVFIVSLLIIISSANGPKFNTFASQAPFAYSDEQLGLTFAQNLSKLTVAVDAISQNDNQGYGPLYSLNGLTDSGEWYQVGLVWNWNLLNGGHDEGFQFFYEVYNKTGASVYPQNCSSCGGIENFAGAIHQDDEVQLTLEFQNQNITMLAKDKQTGAYAEKSYYAENASQFVGLDSAGNNNGFFSGLMTEQKHLAPYFQNELSEIYSMNGTDSLKQATLWIDEYDTLNKTIFEIPFNSELVSFLGVSSKLQTFAEDSAMESVNSDTFVTGAPANSVPESFDFYPSDSSPSDVPQIQFVSDGITRVANLERNVTVLYLDPRSEWNVSQLLSNSNSNERWIASQSQGESSEENITIDYDLQFNVTIVSRIMFGTTNFSWEWVNAKSKIRIMANDSLLDIFEQWKGEGSNSYSGSSKNATLVVNGPVRESAYSINLVPVIEIFLAVMLLVTILALARKLRKRGISKFDTPYVSFQSKRTIVNSLLESRFF